MEQPRAASEQQCSTSYSTSNPGFDTEGLPDRVLRKAEAVLANRTDRIILVLERCTDNVNYLTCLRTAEVLGEIDWRVVLLLHCLQGLSFRR